MDQSTVMVENIAEMRKRQQKQDYKSRLEVIRNPEVNHMSRTRSKIDRFVKKNNKDSLSPVGKRRKKEYDGAYVADPRRQVPSGFELAGRLMPHIHNFVIDMDLSSLYPSIMILCNLSPKTFAGKVMLKDKFDIPMYQIQFLDRDEKHDYKPNQDDFLMEAYIGKHWWAVFEYFFGMKSTNDILNEIAANMKYFI